jgi:hypothetical protein
MLEVEDTSIKRVVHSLFKSNNYDISNEKLYNTGEWFSCSLVVYQINPFSGSGLSDPDNHDDYHIVLKKNPTTNTWKLVGGASLLLTKPDNPSIPEYILDDLAQN